ncbi:MAG: hypothetical protein DME49_08480 [Verrucomicrobia bacterium]|nr:MAG: hypothetical protein DME49_08480 [Verrucomicrobiota bacterium]PYK94777.1 MAG: hypothetical protein DME36_04405 [Verrucomicrobiota bacterium]
MKNHTSDHYRRALQHFIQSMIVAAFTPALIFGITIGTSCAGSGTWILNPINDDWNTAANWSSDTVPGPLDEATFGVSNQTDISVSAPASVGGITFNAGADAYQITAPPSQSLGIEGTGIDNESGIVQNFVAAVDDAGNAGVLGFDTHATAGGLTVFTTEARTVVGGNTGLVQFVDLASGGSATIINNGGIVSGAGGGETDVVNSSTLDMANITNKAGVVSGASGGVTSFFLESPSAGDSVITCEGATVSGAAGGTTIFHGDSRGANATLIANGGANGGTGGSIRFEDSSKGTAGQVKLFGDGSLDISAHAGQPVTIGSLEGDGEVFLGARTLTVGGNSLSTTFSGIIQDGGLGGGVGGSLSKIGTGTLRLTGGNTYTGGTTLTKGALIVKNKTGSATGTGPVQVNLGTLQGIGKISGAVTVGTGTTSGAIPGR